jgi:hypothetical protein
MLINIIKKKKEKKTTKKKKTKTSEYLFSSTSSTVADPSTVTVRIESASTSDLNAQDVSTSSSSNDDNDDDDDVEFKQHREKKTLIDRLNYRTSSAASRRHTSTIEVHRQKSSLHQKRPNRLNTDANSMRIPQSRPTTAISLPAKSSTYDNEWDFESDQTLGSSTQRRNPSCPSISPTTVRSKSSSSSQSPIVPKFSPQQAPPVFTTTSECLGN